jgi:hypothetical protein
MYFVGLHIYYRELLIRTKLLFIQAVSPLLQAQRHLFGFYVIQMLRIVH